MIDEELLEFLSQELYVFEELKRHTESSLLAIINSIVAIKKKRAGLQKKKL